MPVQRFRTKIVEIDAIRVSATNMEEVREFTGRENYSPQKADEDIPAHFTDWNLDGVSYHVFDYLHHKWIPVAPGQWIVKGAVGEYYPCDDETFHWKYEEVLDPTEAEITESIDVIKHAIATIKSDAVLARLYDSGRISLLEDEKTALETGRDNG